MNSPEPVTVIDIKGELLSVATEWKDFGKFEDLLVERLTKKSAVAALGE